MAPLAKRPDTQRGGTWSRDCHLHCADLTTGVSSVPKKSDIRNGFYHSPTATVRILVHYRRHQTWLFSTIFSLATFIGSPAGSGVATRRLRSIGRAALYRLSFINITERRSFPFRVIPAVSTISLLCPGAYNSRICESSLFQFRPYTVTIPTSSLTFPSQPSTVSRIQWTTLHDLSSWCSPYLQFFTPITPKSYCSSIILMRHCTPWREDPTREDRGRFFHNVGGTVG